MVSISKLVLGFFLFARSIAADKSSTTDSASATCQAKRPNVVFIFADDQDLHLNSTNYMPNLQKLLSEEGTTFTNHFATVSNCCPSRASLFRGQHGHNTNITHVKAPGGNYQKWVLSGEDDDYLPKWLGKAGYRTEYIGKFLNGYDRVLYKQKPKSWDFVDALVDPWMYIFNTPVFSKNGETPILYDGYHQTDVIRAKALSRIHYLTESQDKPFYLTIAPSSPHVETNIGLPVPLIRHEDDYRHLDAPRGDNFNPEQKYTNQKPSWLKNLTDLDNSQLDRINVHYRRRIQALLGIDEIVHDVVNLLKEKGLLDNTYIIYSSDNGYHLGQHRVTAGKTLPYFADTNIPLIVRGPNVPQGQTSRLPGAHLDLAPTLLDIACADQDAYPGFLDGRSLLEQWHNPHNATGSGHRDIINVEFWGHSSVESPSQKGSKKNSYKALRIVSEKSSWLYTRWCTNETELYDTISDPFELKNLAHEMNNPDHETHRLMHRLKALLMITKSCEKDHCRNPWTVLDTRCESQGDCPGSGEIFHNLDQAMDKKYDTFFKNLPRVEFKECLQVQEARNEGPFIPESSRSLGRDHRIYVGRYNTTPAHPKKKIPYHKPEGTKDQRHKTIKDMMKTARKLTAEELGNGKQMTKEDKVRELDNPYNE